MEPCRYAAGDPTHVCRDSFGNLINGDKVCFREAAAQLRDRADEMAERHAQRIVAGKDQAAGS